MVVHLASTLVPTAVIVAMAAATSRPAINAHSITSPPRSSIQKRRRVVRFGNTICSFGDLAQCSERSSHYIDWLSEVHFASTLVPTEVIAAIAATTIKPTIRAYSSTSPPCSSLTSFVTRFQVAFMADSLVGGCRSDLRSDRLVTRGHDRPDRRPCRTYDIAGAPCASSVPAKRRCRVRLPAGRKSTRPRAHPIALISSTHIKGGLTS